MKILYFVSEDWYFCSHRLSHAVAAKAEGHDVIVLTKLSTHREMISSAGLKVIHIEFNRHGLNPLKELKCLFKIWRVYRTHTPDIVHHVALKPALYGSLIAMLIGHVKVVNAIAGMGFLYTSKSNKAKLLKFFVNLAFKIFFSRTCSQLIVQNQDDFNYFFKNVSIKLDKIKLIRGVGVNTQVFFPKMVQRNKPMVMVAARLLWSKGINEFIEAAQLLKSEGSQARFVVVGECDSNNPENISINQINKWKKKGIVEFWGHRTDMVKVIGSADILCLPSYREGLPKVLVEGAALAKPLIATDVPGCREIIQNEKNGLLIPVKDSEALATAIRVLLNSSELREQMGNNGRTLVENMFDEKIIIKKTLNLYKEITKKKLIYFISEDWYFCSHRLSLSIAAKNHDYDVSVISRFTKHRDIIERSGIKAIPISLSRLGMNPLKELVVFLNILKIYIRERPDIVHHVAIKPVLYGSIAALIVGRIHVINAMAGMGYIFSTEKKATKFLRFFIKNAFKLILSRLNFDLILQNPDDVKFFEKNKIVKKNKITLIRGSGVDLYKYFPVKKNINTPVVLLASRLIWDKGIGDFVQAATLLKGSVDARFVIVGEVDQENPTAIPLDCINDWHRSGVIEWWGYQSDMHKIFTLSHIACLPSYYGEGVPKFLIEAASSGLPIVATDWPGCREIVENGKNGFLVPIKNPQILALKLKEMIENPDIWDQMGLKGREKVEREFTLENVINETLKLYKKNSFERL
jgi:glycosyltransferase involved in cell wall biosynthesis